MRGKGNLEERRFDLLWIVVENLMDNKKVTLRDIDFKEASIYLNIECKDPVEAARQRFKNLRREMKKRDDEHDGGLTSDKVAKTAKAPAKKSKKSAHATGENRSTAGPTSIEQQNNSEVAKGKSRNKRSSGVSGKSDKGTDQKGDEAANRIQVKQENSLVYAALEEGVENELSVSKDEEGPDCESKDPDPSELRIWLSWNSALAMTRPDV